MRTNTCLLLLLAAGTVTSNVFAAGKPAQSAPPRRLERVVVTRVGEAPNTVRRRYTGQIVPISSVDVVATVSGEIMSQGFKDGDYVTQKQVLYNIDDIQYQAAVKAAEARIAKIKAALEYASSSYSRSETLYQKKAVSLDNKESLQGTLAGLRAELQAAEAELIIALDNLEGTRIDAPIAGKTGKSLYTPGNNVSPSKGTLVTIVQTDPIRVRFSISLHDYLSHFNGSESLLRKDAKITLVLADGRKYPLTGEVEIVSNVVAQSSDSIQIWAKFANPDSILIPGGAVEVHLEKTGDLVCPAVPPHAVLHDQRGAYVLALTPKNVVEKRRITLGASSAGVQVIESGLRKGETVIVEGSHKAIPGMEVIPVPAPQPGAAATEEVK